MESLGAVGDCAGGFGAIFKGFVLIPSSTAPERLPAEVIMGSEAFTRC